MNHALQFTRWQALMRALKYDEQLHTFEQLELAYGEKHRHYHNQRHINACLAYVDEAKSNIQEPLVVEMALWFHDAIYKTRRSDNEMQSANWANQFLDSAGAEDKFREKVQQCILATQHHQHHSDHSCNWTVDIDLSILGQSSTIFDEFEDNIRKEYAWVPLFVYKKKRRSILQDFLHSERIYKTDYFYEKLENQARENLQALIHKLKS